jgi:hypothetical protein
MRCLHSVDYPVIMLLDSISVFTRKTQCNTEIASEIVDANLKLKNVISDFSPLSYSLIC